MNGDTAGLEPTDTSGEAADQLRRWRDALTTFNATAKAACDVHEYHLQREAEDAAARCVGHIQALEREVALHERSLDGQDSEDAR